MFVIGNYVIIIVCCFRMNFVYLCFASEYGIFGSVRNQNYQKTGEYHHLLPY